MKALKLIERVEYFKKKRGETTQQESPNHDAQTESRAESSVAYSCGIDPRTGIKYIYEENDVAERTVVGRLPDGQLVYHVQWTNGASLDLY